MHCHRNFDEFADIKSQADVERMANEDMPRYVKWSESQRQIGRAIDEVKAARPGPLRGLVAPCD